MLQAEDHCRFVESIPKHLIPSFTWAGSSKNVDPYCSKQTVRSTADHRRAHALHRMRAPGPLKFVHHGRRLNRELVGEAEALSLVTHLLGGFRRIFDAGRPSCRPVVSVASGAYAKLPV